MKNSSFFRMPVTQPGRWSVWLELMFVVMFIVNVVILSLVQDETFWRQAILPFYGSFMLLSGLAGGVFGLTAVIRQKERTAIVWLATLVGLFVLLIVLNELMQLVIYLRGA